MRGVQTSPERVRAQHQNLELHARRKGSNLDSGRAASARFRAKPFTWKSVVKLWSFLPRSLATAALFVSALSCSENLDSSGVCSVLCPPIGADVQNITLDAIVMDTTVQSLSGLGTEPGLLLAARGDTLDTRVVIRFDSLPVRFVPAGDTSQLLKSVDSAYIELRIDTLSISRAGLRSGAPRSPTLFLGRLLSDRFPRGIRPSKFAFHRARTSLHCARD